MTTALVLGGASGIGAAVAQALRKRGDDVFLVDRRPDASSVTGPDLPGRAGFLQLDLADADAAATSVDAALHFSGGTLDTVFYNAGVLEAYPLSEWTIEAWDRTLAVNLRTPFLLAQRVAPTLAASAVGRLIMTSSTGALRGHAGMPAYHASKSGVLGLVRSLADELGPLGVTVNAVCPGWIDTPFNDAFWHHQGDPDAAAKSLAKSIPLRRQGTPADVVGTVLFLASPASAYLTGQAIVVDGGYTAV